MLGIEGLSIFDPDRFALDLLSMILGEGMSSRLFTEIREKLGLAYDIHSYVEHFRETGSFVIQAGIDPSQTGKAVRAILEQAVGGQGRHIQSGIGQGQGDGQGTHAVEHGEQPQRGGLVRRAGGTDGQDNDCRRGYTDY